MVKVTTRTLFRFCPIELSPPVFPLRLWYSSSRTSQSRNQSSCPRRSCPLIHSPKALHGSLQSHVGESRVTKGRRVCSALQRFFVQGVESMEHCKQSQFNHCSRFNRCSLSLSPSPVTAASESFTKRPVRIVCSSCSGVEADQSAVWVVLPPGPPLQCNHSTTLELNKVAKSAQ